MKKVFLLCNAHIDPVWQWDIAEGKSVALSTFSSVANLLDSYDFVFCHNESVLYEWVEEYDPQLFARIKTFIEKGKWKIMGGWYLQPDCNIPTAESIIRQVLTGRKYFAEKFNQPANTVATNLDSFGHSQGLPYVLNKLGITGYVSHRPMEFFLPLAPDFTWKGLGGGELKFSRPSSYNSEMGKAREKIEAEMDIAKDDETLIVLWGVGNHGGGPSRLDLERIEDLKKEMPDVEFVYSSPEEFFAENKYFSRKEFQGDLYPCFPGCYTSQIEIKQTHRQLENLFYATEKLLSYADMSGVTEYPSEEMDKIQKVLLFAQFHDILPGTTVRFVKEEALRMIGEGINRLNALNAKAMYMLAKDCKKALPLEYPVFVFNPAPYKVTEYIENPVLMAERFFEGFADLEVRNDKGTVVSQVIKEDSNIPIEWAKKVAFEAELEPMSLTRFDIKCVHRPEKPVLPVCNEDITIENNGRKVTVGINSGLIESLVVDGTEYIGSPAFLPVIYEDNEDPWAMQPYQQKRLVERQKPFRLASRKEAAVISGCKTEELSPVRIIEDGRFFCVIEAVFIADNSSVVTQYKVYKTSRKIVVDMELDFNHKDKMIKLEIPSKNMSCAETQILGGFENVPSDGSERVCHKWVLLRDEKKNKALAVINNCIYGFSAKGNVLQLSLVRGTAYTAHFISPDRRILRDDRYSPRCDQGEHRYSFEILADSYDKVKEKIDREALSFNEKPFVQNIFPQGNNEIEKSGISLSGDGTVVMTAMKKSSDGSYVIRLVNTSDGEAKAAFIAQKQSISCTFEPFEIKTLELNGTVLKEIKEIKI